MLNPKLETGIFLTISIHSDKNILHMNKSEWKKNLRPMSVIKLTSVPSNTYM